MADINTSSLRPVVVERLMPLMEKLTSDWGEDLTHVFVVGSAVTTNFDEKVSDINTLVVLREIHFAQLTSLARMGAKLGRRGIAAPMLFTRRQIDRSLDVFPVEFLTFKLHHQCILGEDFLAGLEIRKPELRLQCERELRRAVVRLGQDYLRAQGNRKLLAGLLRAAYSSVLPVLTAVLFMTDKEIPSERAGLVAAGCRAVRIDPKPLALLEQLRRSAIKPDATELTGMCEQTHTTLERLTDAVDTLKV